MKKKIDNNYSRTIWLINIYDFTIHRVLLNSAIFLFLSSPCPPPKKNDSNRHPECLNESVRRMNEFADNLAHPLENRGR